jgi:hypothetical protein
MNPAYHRLLLLQQELATANVVLAPCLPTADLAAFEQAHQVSLPPEYRLFLTHIGNGGAGPPAYGLRALGATEAWWADDQRAAWEHFQALRRPFPFAQPWCWADEAAPDPARLAAVYDGSLYLGTDGCGLDWALVVTGPQRGYVWQLSEEGVLPCRPALTFFQWVSAWLHRDPASSSPFWWAV